LIFWFSIVAVIAASGSKTGEDGGTSGAGTTVMFVFCCACKRFN